VGGEENEADFEDFKEPTSSPKESEATPPKIESHELKQE